MTNRPHPDAQDLPPVQRGTGLTAWRQIADRIEADITHGLFMPGERLPSEMEFAERFGVNRHTVRRALAALAARGLVRATQGNGTFVEAPPVVYPIGPKTRFSEVMTRAGREAWGDLIRASPIPAHASIAEALHVAPDADVLELVTVHKADGVPISMARTWLPLPRFDGLDVTYQQEGSLTRAYAKHGVCDYARLSTRISGRLASREEAALLELSAGRVLLVIDSINIDQRGRRIQVTRSHFAADRVDLIVESEHR